jgi:hypothetical protein
MSVCSAKIIAGQRDTFRPQALADDKNYSERSLYYPVLKVEHAQSGKGQQAQKGE